MGAIATVGDPLGRRGQLAGRRGLHLRDVALPRRQEFPDRRVGARHGSRRPGRRLVRLRLQGGLPERPVGHRAHLQAHRPRLRSVARLRPPARRPPDRTARPTIAPGWRAARFRSCSISSRPVDGAGPLGPMGELPRVLRAGELALPERRPLRVQRQPDRRASRGPLRNRETSPSCLAAYHWRRYRLEGGTAEKRRLYVQVDMVVRRLLRRLAGPVPIGPALGTRLPC